MVNKKIDINEITKVEFGWRLPLFRNIRIYYIFFKEEEIHYEGFKRYRKKRWRNGGIFGLFNTKTGTIIIGTNPPCSYCDSVNYLNNEEMEVRNAWLRLNNK